MGITQAVKTLRRPKQFVLRPGGWLPSVAVFSAALLTTAEFGLPGYLTLFVLLGALVIIKPSSARAFRDLNKDALIDILLTAIIISLALDIIQSMAFSGPDRTTAYNKSLSFSPAKKGNPKLEGGGSLKSLASRGDTDASVPSRHETTQTASSTTTESIGNATNARVGSTTRASVVNGAGANRNRRSRNTLPPARKRHTTTPPSPAEHSHHHQTPKRKNTFTTLKRPPAQPEIVLIESRPCELGEDPNNRGKDAHRNDRRHKDKNDDADKTSSKKKKNSLESHKRHQKHKPEVVNAKSR